MNTGVLEVTVRYSNNIPQSVRVSLLTPANQDKWISAVKRVMCCSSDCTMIFVRAQQWKQETPVRYDQKLCMIKTDPVLLPYSARRESSLRFLRGRHQAN